MPEPAETPMLMAFLRILAVVGLTESIFYRLLPDPLPAASPSLLNRVHGWLDGAGQVAFWLGFFFCLAALVTIAWNSIRRKLWPAGLNGFLSVCFLSLTALSASALVVRHGPAFAMGFTLLAILTLLFMASHAFSVTSSRWEKGLAVFYSAAVLCSMVDSFIAFSEQLALLDSGPGSVLSDLGEPALAAGTLLIAATGVCAFMAFCDQGRSVSPGGPPLWSVILVSAAPAVGFAAGCLVAPPGQALLGPEPEPIAVVLLSAAIFLGSMTAAVSLLGPQKRALGYGLLLLMLAGFPLRIAYQDLLMVLGSALVFLPRRAGESAVRISVTEPVPARDPLP